MTAVDENLLKLLRCPETGQGLRLAGGSLAGGSLAGGALETADGHRRYAVSKSGIPLFTASVCSPDGLTQQQHYDKVAGGYLENLEYPHTAVYNETLDAALLAAAGEAKLDAVAELCCGQGESFKLFHHRIKQGAGVDVSINMLEAARRRLDASQVLLVQGDATRTPLTSEAFDGVFILGGIHHVNDRRALFREVWRILKPGGIFCWREPVNDFFLWRWLRWFFYRFSTALDYETEHPLRYEETAAQLKQAGLALQEWATFGFFGYCLFMNSDVLVFNRLFGFIPGIKAITRAAAALDRLIIKIPGMGHYGLIAIGKAVKP